MQWKWKKFHPTLMVSMFKRGGKGNFHEDGTKQVSRTLYMKNLHVEVG